MSNLTPVVDTTLYVEPKPKQRPRAAIARGKKGNTVKMFTPPGTKEFESKCKFLFKGYMRRENVDMLTEPCALLFKFYLPTRHKVDVDNLVKSAADAGLGVLYKDDSQVQAMYASKCLDRDRPRIEVQLYTMKDFKAHYAGILATFIQSDIDDYAE